MPTCIEYALIFHLVTAHFPNDSSLNGGTPGLGVACLHENIEVAGGGYLNSYNRFSPYIAGGYQFGFFRDHIKIGPVVHAAFNYPGPEQDVGPLAMTGGLQEAFRFRALSFQFTELAGRRDVAIHFSVQVNPDDDER